MKPLHLDIDAHVVYQLGAELITDAEQALLELVKNSYDADATWCSVIIDTKYCEEIDAKSDSTEARAVRHDKIKSDSKVKRTVLSGKITVEDGGCGMTEKEIRDGWLMISISPKRIMKQKGIKTPKCNRTPLGDKGLGRLGTMKLGNRLTIYTHHNPSEDGLKVILYWDDCKTGQPLTSIPVVIEAIPPSGKTGTKIEICGLTDINYWVGNQRIKDLEKKLSTLISPFKAFESFTISVQCDGKEIDMVQFPKTFFDTAISHFELIWDNESLDLAGKLKLDIFEGDDPDFFKCHIWSDCGERFRKLNHINFFAITLHRYSE